MYQVIRIIQQKTDVLYSYLDCNAKLSKLLYNAALFRIRQIFCGWDKAPASRSANEREVFREVSITQETLPGTRIRRTISYKHLEKLMRATRNPDFFAGLPMQTAQAVVNQAHQDFKNWLSALRDYRKSPGRYPGKPKMPGYKKADICTYTFTNQDAVLYQEAEGGVSLKLPLTKDRLAVNVIPAGRLKEVKVRPYYGRYILALGIEVDDVPKRVDFPHIAAIDFGTDNIAAFVCTDHTSAIYKGGAVLNDNQWFAKKRARLAGIITKGHTHKHASSRQLANLSYHHANFQLDQMHKISRNIINRCVEHKVGTLVLGVNKNWKQGVNIGSANNQKFVSVPITLLRQLISYKASAAGITVIEQEESYTSKADATANDRIPSYGVDDKDAVFSGRRISRGLYRCHDGLAINADCNGAANILRKAFPNVWKETSDFRFLASPDVLGFHELNPQSIAVKRIAAA